MNERQSILPPANTEELDQLKSRLELFVRLKYKGPNPNAVFIDPKVLEFSADLAQRHEGPDRIAVVDALCGALLEYHEKAAGEKPTEVKTEIFTHLFIANVNMKINGRLRPHSDIQEIQTETGGSFKNSRTGFEAAE